MIHCQKEKIVFVVLDDDHSLPDIQEKHNFSVGRSDYFHHFTELLCSIFPNQEILSQINWLHGRLDFIGGKCLSLITSIHSRSIAQAESDGISGQLSSFVPPDACTTTSMLDDDRIPLGIRLAQFLSQPKQSNFYSIFLYLFIFHQHD